MELKRKPFQGVSNIIRFNWHFYVIALFAILGLILFKNFFPQFLHPIIVYGILLIVITTSLSILVSYYIYDYSNLYQLNWLNDSNGKKVLNINAGFDETSEILRGRFSNIDLTICDFYDPKKHTEVSIKRARKAYPPKKNTISIKTNRLLFSDKIFDQSIAILSAHEIRDEDERILFFKELNRVTKNSGKIYVTEHLRDWNNFFAYTIGFLHFHSKKSWLKTFKAANLSLKKEIKITPFITTFELEKNGNTF